MKTMGILLAILVFLALAGIIFLIRELVNRGVNKAVDAIHNANAKSTKDKDLANQANLSERYKK